MSTTELHGHANELAEIIVGLQRTMLVSAFRKVDRERLTSQQFFVMDVLRQGPCRSMAELAKKLGHTAAAVVSLVDRLERNELVIRHQLPNDRRTRAVRITDRGLDLYNAVRTEMSHCILSVFKNVPQPEREAWLQSYRLIRSEQEKFMHGADSEAQGRGAGFAVDCGI